MDEEGILGCLNPSQGQLPLRTTVSSRLERLTALVLIPLRVNCLFGLTSGTPDAPPPVCVLIPLRVNCLFGPIGLVLLGLSILWS